MRPIDKQSTPQSLQCGRSFKAEGPKKRLLRRYSSEITSEFAGCGTRPRGQLSKAVALASLILFPLVAQADVMGDIVTFFDTDGTLSMSVTGPPRTFFGGPFCSGVECGVILGGPAPDVVLMSSPALENLVGDPADPFVAKPILAMFNFPPRPGELAQEEISLFPSVDLSPSQCSFVPNCHPLQNGVPYIVGQLDWTDGTVDTIEVQWTVTPEPGSLLLILTAAGILVTRKRHLRVLP